MQIAPYQPLKNVYSPLQWKSFCESLPDPKSEFLSQWANNSHQACRVILNSTWRLEHEDDDDLQLICSIPLTDVDPNKLISTLIVIIDNSTQIANLKARIKINDWTLEQRIFSPAVLNEEQRSCRLLPLPFPFSKNLLISEQAKNFRLEICVAVDSPEDAIDVQLPNRISLFYMLDLLSQRQQEHIREATIFFEALDVVYKEGKLVTLGITGADSLLSQIAKMCWMPEFRSNYKLLSDFASSAVDRLYNNYIAEQISHQAQSLEAKLTR